jgi:hypothetical protein
MNGLFPIIRRKRRPLVVDVPPAVVAPVQPVASKPLVESVPVLADGHQPAPESVPDGPSEKPKTTDAKPAPQDESY